MLIIATYKPWMRRLGGMPLTSTLVYIVPPKAPLYARRSPTLVVFYSLNNTHLLSLRRTKNRNDDVWSKDVSHKSLWIKKTLSQLTDLSERTKVNGQMMNLTQIFNIQYIYHCSFIVLFVSKLNFIISKQDYS
jgi:hypothetical protein